MIPITASKMSNILGIRPTRIQNHYGTVRAPSMTECSGKAGKLPGLLQSVFHRLTKNSKQSVQEGQQLLPQLLAPQQSMPSRLCRATQAKPALLLLQGTCRNNVCVCTPGYSGTYCEVPPTCGVINDINGNCCKNGVVSQAGICCGPVGHTLAPNITHYSLLGNGR